MARRFRQRRFGRRRLGHANSPKWFTTNFNEGSLNLDGTVQEFAIGNPQVWDGADSREINRVYSIRRVICNGFIGVAPNTTAVATEITAWFWACHLIDADDTDGLTTASAAGSIWNTERVIQSGCVGGTNIEVPSAQIGDFWIPGLRVDFDITTNISMRQDQFLVIAILAGSTATSALALATFSACTRVLLVPP